MYGLGRWADEKNVPFRLFWTAFSVTFKKIFPLSKSKVNEPMFHFYILSPFIFTKRALLSKFIASTGKAFLTVYMFCNDYSTLLHVSKIR